jgi:hypothetical protein
MTPVRLRLSNQSHTSPVGLIFEFADETEITSNNAELVDNNTSQTLTCDEIGQMRQSGADGAQIIEALISNSKTFASEALSTTSK